MSLNNVIPAWLLTDNSTTEFEARLSLKAVSLALNLVGQCAFEMGDTVWGDHAWYKWCGIWADPDHSCTIALRKCWAFEGR